MEERRFQGDPAVVNDGGGRISGSHREGVGGWGSADLPTSPDPALIMAHGSGGPPSEGPVNDNASTAPNGTRLIIRPIGEDISVEELRGLFGQYGDLTDVHIPHIPRHANSQEVRGFAFVEFTEPSMAQAVKQSANGVILRAVPLSVEFSNPRPGDRNYIPSAGGPPPPPYSHNPYQPLPPPLTPPPTSSSSGGARLMVKPIGQTATSDDLRTLFAAFGDLVDLHIPRDYDGVLRGYVFVEFANPEMADAARVGLNGMPFRGHPMTIEVAVRGRTTQEEMERRRQMLLSGALTDSASVMSGTSGRSFPVPHYPSSAPSESSGYPYRSRSSLSPPPDGSQAPLLALDKPRLLIRPVPSNITVEDLRAEFAIYGPIKDAHIPTRKPFGFVEYYTFDNAASALAFSNGKEMFGTTVLVEFAMEKQKAPHEMELKRSARTAGIASASPSAPAAKYPYRPTR